MSVDFNKLLAELPAVLTAEEMAAVDKYTIETLNLPGRVLMENAGRAMFEIIRQRWHPLAGKRVTIFCGKGNNGGDGMVICRLLREAGAWCETYLLGQPADLRGDAAANYELLVKLGAQVTSITENSAPPSLRGVDFAIDALLGTGVRGPLQGLLARVVDHINASGIPVLAVDLPTGMNADNGAVEGPCIRAHLTVTIGARKTGLLFSPAREFAGEVHVADIGFPRMAFEAALSSRCHLLAGPTMAQWLPQREPTAFKNRVGQILVVAGSRGFGGAGRMTATSALRAGAGLVVLAAPESLITALESATAEVIKHPLPEKDGALAPGVFGHLQERMRWAEVLAIGPGLGTSPGAAEMVRALVAEFKGTVVLDADGLNVMAGELETIRKSPAQIVLTPHPGELSRLVSVDKSELKEAPLEVARRVAQDLGHVLVLKGAPTIVALPSGELMINSTGNAGMATGGSGDVLTGIIAGLAGQGLPPGMAAGLGVYLHGLAGDMARDKLGMWSMIAGDILEAVPEAFLRTMNYALDWSQQDRRKIN